MVQLSTTQTQTHTHTHPSIRTGEDGEDPRASSRLKAAAIVLIEKAQEARVARPRLWSVQSVQTRLKNPRVLPHSNFSWFWCVHVRLASGLGLETGMCVAHTP